MADPGRAPGALKGYQAGREPREERGKRVWLGVRKTWDPYGAGKVKGDGDGQEGPSSGEESNKGGGNAKDEEEEQRQTEAWRCGVRRRPG